MSSLSSAPSPDAQMPLFGHLAELRARLRDAALGLLVMAVVAYPFRGRIFAWLINPWVDAIKKHDSLKGGLVYTALPEVFMVFLKAALVAGLFFASPWIFFQLWRFIAPGLHRREKQWALPFVLGAACLFVAGGLFCYYFVLPASYDFFLSEGQSADQLLRDYFSSRQIALDVALRPTITLDEYYGLTLMLLVVFALIFQLPLLLAILSLTGLVSARSLWKFNRYAVLIFAVLGALLTPGDLVVGQLMMAGALTVLYNLSIGIVWLIGRKRENALPDQDGTATSG